MKPTEVAAEAVVWGLIEAEAKQRKDTARAWLAERMGPDLLAVKAITPGGDDVGKASFMEGRREFKVVDLQAFTKFVAEHYPSELVPSVNAAFQKRILSDMTDVAGTVVDSNGVPVPGVEYRHGAPYVAVRKSATARDTVAGLLAGGGLVLDQVQEIEA